jgi:hypothetical protein
MWNMSTTCFVRFIFPTLTQLNINISNVIGITWQVEWQGREGGGTNVPSILSLRGTSKKDFLNNYLGCVKVEKNDKLMFEQNLSNFFKLSPS